MTASSASCASSRAARRMIGSMEEEARDILRWRASRGAAGRRTIWRERHAATGRAVWEGSELPPFPARSDCESLPISRDRPRHERIVGGPAASSFSRRSYVGCGRSLRRRAHSPPPLPKGEMFVWRGLAAGWETAAVALDGGDNCLSCAAISSLAGSCPFDRRRWRESSRTSLLRGGAGPGGRLARADGRIAAIARLAAAPVSRRGNVTVISRIAGADQPSSIRL